MFKSGLGNRTEVNPKMEEVLGLRKDRIWNDPTSRSRQVSI